MITYLVTQKHAYTMRTFISLWGKRHLPGIRVMSYEYLLRSRALTRGSYIFSDIERLNSKQADDLAKILELLSEKNNTGSCLFNHPLRSMRRYQLVRTLYERGINSYNIYRPDEKQNIKNYPVFLRYENEHSGNLSPLLHTPDDLEQAIKKISSHKNEMVIVEFCDTSDPRGIFRKYSAFIVGGRIIPQHIMFGRHWMIKSVKDLADEEADILEEKDYVMNNPHEKELREIFKLAEISYGRVDYALLDGKIQVWEINTNPIIIGIGAGSEKRGEVRIHFLKQITSAFEAISDSVEEHALQYSVGWRVFITDRYYALRHGAARIAARIRYGEDKALLKAKI